MIKELIVIKATVLTSKYGADIIILTTNYPTAMPKISNEPLYLKFDAEQGTGELYVIDNFGVCPEVINND